LTISVRPPRRSKSCGVQTPWKGDPRVNIQKGENGVAKPYQVRQVQNAVEKKKEEESE